MAFHSILYCAIVLHAILIIGADQVTERSDQNPNLTYVQKFGDKENKVLRHFKKVKLPFHSELSYSYQKVLTEHDVDSFRSMNNYSKIILKPTIEMIQKLQVEYQEREIPLWIYKSVFKRFSGLDLDETRTNSLHMDLPTKKGIATGKNEDHFLKQMIKSWIHKLIGNNDVMRASHINEDSVYETLSKLGSNFENWKSAFYHVLREEQEIVDVGVLRYLDTDSPFYLFYHLRLAVYRTSKKIMSVYQVDKNGVRGSITICHYVPDKETKEKFDLKNIIDNETKRAESILG